MKSFVIRVLLGLMSIMPAVGIALEDVNIGILQVQKVFQDSSKAQKIDEQLRTRFSKREQELVKAETAVAEQQEHYRKEVTTMSDEERTALEQKITAEIQTLQGNIQKYQEDLVAARQEETQKFLTVIEAAVKKIANDKKINLILHREAVFYLNDDLSKLDITAAVVQAVDKK